MVITRDTPFSPEDDNYHKLSDNPLDLETNWWAINIPGRRIGIWLHTAYYPNRDLVRSRIFAWDPRGADPARLIYYKNVETPLGPDPDMRDIQYPQGYSLKVLEPLMAYHLGYSDPERNFALEFEFHAAHPPHRFTPGEAPCVDNPHIDQLGRFTGELTLYGERIPIDCWSVRDRTWGPREGAHAASTKYAGQAKTRVLHPGGPRWREIERERGRGRIQYIFGHTDDQTGFLSFVRPQDGDAYGRSPLNMGWLLKDGRFTRLDKAKSWMRNYRDKDTGWSQHMEVLLVDEEGRSMEAEGFTVSHMCEHGAGSNALMRWEYDGKIGWGEDQDGWRVDHFSRMLGALRTAR
ncbi:hypothetical protein [Sphingobium sp. Sx8-8]|uniref:DUF7064 domain-containing protein n=1 Tax=Sphingobium sp. Sx8-8 TaxID=2933617 RepID=UPI001F55FEBD|nr:hypothetical protein [Sphingobium sp. Sx8-8]